MIGGNGGGNNGYGGGQQQMGGYGGGGSGYEEPQGKPEPYKFSYKVDDGYGNNHYHMEDAGDDGVKKGSYGYTDAYGVYRQVDYTADQNGFRAYIKTNEVISESLSFA